MHDLLGLVVDPTHRRQPFRSSPHGLTYQDQQDFLYSGTSDRAQREREQDNEERAYHKGTSNRKMYDIENSYSPTLNIGGMYKNHASETLSRKRKNVEKENGQRNKRHEKESEPHVSLYQHGMIPASYPQQPVQGYTAYTHQDHYTTNLDYKQPTSSFQRPIRHDSDYDTINSSHWQQRGREENTNRKVDWQSHGSEARGEYVPIQTIQPSPLSFSPRQQPKPAFPDQSPPPPFHPSVPQTPPRPPQSF